MRFFLLIPISLLSLLASAESDERKPNVLFIISDDQGYSDFGFTGNSIIKTPFLDRLASESATFKNFIVTPACSPSRIAFFTGRDHLFTGVWGVPNRDNLHTDEALMPAWFREAGYATFYAGKRDMGSPPYTTPWERGWDNGYFVSGYQHRHPRLPNREKTIRPKGWTCNITTNLIIDFWKKNPDRPWFVTAAYIIPHLPFVTYDAFFKPYMDAGLSKELALCYGSITQMDWAIGLLLKGLRETGQEKNTIVVFVSDNGMSAKAESGVGGKPWTSQELSVRNKHGLRGFKASVWENGIKVPCLIRWPEKIIPGDREQLGAAEDILPTVLDLAGIDASTVKHHPFTGVSLKPALSSPKTSFQRPDLFRIAISGDGAPKPLAKQRLLKNHHLVLRGPRYKFHSLPGGKTALYDIQTDSQEKTDLKSELPEVTEVMAKEIRKRWDAVNASKRTFKLRDDNKPDF